MVSPLTALVCSMANIVTPVRQRTDHPGSLTYGPSSLFGHM